MATARKLKSGAKAHDFTQEERAKGGRARAEKRSAPLAKSPGKSRPAVAHLVNILDSTERRKAPEAGLFSYGAAQESNLPSDGLRRLTGFEDRLGHRARAAPRQA